MKYVSQLIVIILFLVSCGQRQKSNQDSSSQDLLQKLQSKFEFYQPLITAKQDSSGFIDIDQCDSLLFTSLLGTAKFNVNLEAAKDSERWNRRPIYLPRCYPDQSSSSISRDMLLGVMYYAWRAQDLNIVEDIFAYGESHSWKMGDGDPSRVYLSVGLQATLAEVIYRLGGEDHKVYRQFPVAFDSDNRGFTVHLDALHILLRAELLGSISETNLKIIQDHLARNPDNALFSYIVAKYSGGNQDRTIQILLNEKYFPADRLSTSADRKTDYLWQREMGDSWEPDIEEPPKEHSAVDFAFVASLILNQ